MTVGSSQKLPAPRSLAPVLSGIAFASGFAALVFEALWFRVAGLSFGNGIWASSIVLASFMAGLALGNGLAARLADRLRSPVAFYAFLELGIGVTGAALVALWPLIHDGLAPLLAGLRDQPWLLNSGRLVFSFALMTIPATAMGATLPVLVKALARSRLPFGQVLGRLYGWNTLGAVFGAVAAEAWFVGAFGVRGSALAAGLIDVAVAGAALFVSRSLAPSAAASSEATDPADAPASAPPRLGRGARWLVAAFASGLLFLALEVVWFRFLSLFVYGTSLVFAVLLSVVLAGISLGGLAASRWIGRGGDARRGLPALALASAVGVLLTYAGYPAVVRALLAPGAAAAALFHVVLISLPLMGPVAFLSGVLFTALGDTARADLEGDARTTGWLTLSNTIGGAIGSLMGGFLWLPGLGIEKSLLLAAAGYALIAAITWTTPPADRGAARTWVLRLGWVAAFVAAWIVFPRGALRAEFLPHPTRPFHEPGSQIVAVREGRLETLVYVRATRFDEPLYYRMFTDGFSMSSTTVASRRYMKAYVYLPAAIHPRLEDALLISYGTGSTAKALTDTRSLERIDVVDISPDVLDMSQVVYPLPGENPLDDPRVRTHIEDGRFYLQTVDRQYDLITSEPPPPKYSGVVNLYSREYFDLVLRRLKPGGIVTYWLPVHGLSESDALAITRGFCDVFADCTLWTGAGLDWMLVGTNGLEGGVSEEHFGRQWLDPVVGPELRDVGFERPAQLAATFLAGTETLRSLTRDTEPLIDDFPERLSNAPFLPSDARGSAFHRDTMDVGAAARELADSGFVRRVVPAPVADAAAAEFRWQQVVNERIVMEGGNLGEADLFEVLSESDLISLPLWLLGSEQREQRIAARAGSRPGADRIRGIGALAARDYAGAAQLFRRARQGRGRQPRVMSLEIFALCMAGEIDQAGRLSRQLLRIAPAAARQDAYWSWLESTFGMQDPRG